MQFFARTDRSSGSLAVHRFTTTVIAMIFLKLIFIATGTCYVLSALYCSNRGHDRKVSNARAT